MTLTFRFRYPVGRLVLLFIITLCFGSVSFAQTDIDRFYRCLNDAESNICKGDFTSAMARYREAYISSDKHLSSKHLYNFFVVAVKLRDWELCSEILTELKRRGWTKQSYSKEIAKIKEVPSTELDSLYDAIDVVVNRDAQFRHLVDSVVEIDRQTNTYYRSKNLAGNLDSAGKDTMARLTSNNMLFLSRLFAVNFPTYEIVDGHAPWGHSRYNIIFRHNVQMVHSHLLDSLLYANVLVNRYAPEDLDFWLTEMQAEKGGRDSLIKLGDKHITVPLFPISYIAFHDSLFEFPTAEDRIRACDSNRKLFGGLCTVKELSDKIAYQYYHKEFTFVPTEYVLLFTDAPPDKLVKRLRYIKSTL